MNGQYKSIKFKTSCHFKQVEDDNCFTYKFVDKKECQTCWKRYRFMEDYLPIKEEYEAHLKRVGKLGDEQSRKYYNWGGSIVVRDEQGSKV